MTDKTKNILLGLLIVGLVSMTVAYASLTQTLQINSSAKVASGMWSVHFKAITSGNPVTTSGYATSTSSSLTLNDTSVTTPTVTLKAPGDSITYLFDVINDGEIDAKLTSVTLPSVTSANVTWGNGETLSASAKTALLNNIKVSLTYADGTALTANTDTLPHTGSNSLRHLKLTITLDSSVTYEGLPTKDLTINGITASLIYTQV